MNAIEIHWSWSDAGWHSLQEGSVIFFEENRRDDQQIAFKTITKQPACYGFLYQQNTKALAVKDAADSAQLLRKTGLTGSLSLVAQDLGLDFQVSTFFQFGCRR